MGPDSASPSSRVGTYDLVSRPWNLAIVAECIAGASRFDDLQFRLGISRKTLAQRLDWLVREGVLERFRYQTRPDRFEYRLTAKGNDLRPTITEVTAWAGRWLFHEDVQEEGPSSR